MSQASFVSTLASLTLAWSVVGCAGKSDPGGSGGETEGSGGIPTGGSPTDASNSDPTVGDDDGDGDGSASGDSTAGTPVTSGSDSTAGETGLEGDGTANDPENPVDCGGAIYACGNGKDDDGDGFLDLEDPECTGPCDDDEATFQTGLPGDNMDCKQDCFFDGNSGQGDDGCNWNLRCDPANPGANVGCEYTGGNNCDNQPQTKQCVEFCSQFTPPGCDCFGCCTVQTDEGAIDIFLNSGPDCSLENIGACQPCTSQIDDCGNPCLPEKCQVCFGETEPPEGCGENTCPNELPCESSTECPTDFFCLLGCCYPPPPG